MERRSFLSALVTFAALGAFPSLVARAVGPARRRRRRQRRRVRRRIRRRHRRRAALRIVRGRRFWIVPVGLAVGWELVHEDRVVVVKEVRVVERNGEKIEVAVVRDLDTTESDEDESREAQDQEIAIIREDSEQNEVELEGSLLPDDDHDTPGVDVEIEDDEEEEAENGEDDQKKEE